MELSLTNNLLQALPLEFGELSKLEKLDLTENNLSQIPFTLVHLTNLKQFCYSARGFKYSTN